MVYFAGKQSVWSHGYLAVKSDTILYSALLMLLSVCIMLSLLLKLSFILELLFATGLVLFEILYVNIVQCPILGNKAELLPEPLAAWSLSWWFVGRLGLLFVKGVLW